MRKNKNALYSYDNVYLTFDPIKANIYAINASICGELGYMAYWLLRGAEKLGYVLPIPNRDQEQALERVKAAGERKPDPVIVCYWRIPKDRLLTEKGNEINWQNQIDCFEKHIHHGELRVIGTFDITEGTIMGLKELIEKCSG